MTVKEFIEMLQSLIEENDIDENASIILQLQDGGGEYDGNGGINGVMISRDKEHKQYVLIF